MVFTAFIELLWRGTARDRCSSLGDDVKEWSSATRFAPFGASRGPQNSG